MKTFGYNSKLEEGEKTLINGFIDHVADDIVYSEIVTKKELAETLILKGIDREFVNKHLDTLIKLEDLYFTIETYVNSTKYVNYCENTIRTWYRQHKGKLNRTYTEIKHDYFDDYNGCWTIDAWRNPDDDEDGVAPIEVYLDGSLKIRDENAFYDAMLDFGIIEAIEETLKEIKSAK
jgi:hypothetical protein